MGLKSKTGDDGSA